MYTVCMISYASVAAAIFLVLAQAAPAQERVDARFDPATRQATITIAVPDGRLAWEDVLRGIARARGYDDRALQGVFPDGRIDLNAAGSQLLIFGLALALHPDVELRYTPTAGGRVESLTVVVNERALLASQRWMKARLRGGYLRSKSDDRRLKHRDFGLILPDGWRERPLDRPLVVLVHGLHSRPEIFEAFARELTEAGYSVGTLRAPNDQSADDSARLLSAGLKRVAREQPRRRVILIGTSLGGLLARQTVEDPALDPGNVRRLIMVGTPNHGSLLAEFAFAAELWEHTAEAGDRRAVQQFYESIEDGLGEVYKDLAPGSEYLDRLNARPRNPNVRYSLLLGDGGFFAPESIDSLRRNWLRSEENGRFRRLLGPRVEGLLADIEEIERGRGDGAVAIKRGRLDGVADTVVLPFNHLSMLTATETPEAQKLRRAVLERLQDDPAAR